VNHTRQTGHVPDADTQADSFRLAAYPGRPATVGLLKAGVLAK